MASENGWEPLHPSADQLEWCTVPGTNVHLQFFKGWPLAILRAFAADFNAYVEPLRDADSAGYTATNSVATSNHLNGTAMDLNWNSHPFRILNAGFDSAKLATMRELLAFYTLKGVQVVWWGNDWNSPKDAMHLNCGYNTYNNPITGEFVARFIRADGFSTFRRGNSADPGPLPPVVLSKADGYAIKIIAEGARRGVTPRGQQIALSVALVESGMQVYANSNVPESMSIPHDKVGIDHDSVGLFQQRCPMWGPANVLMDPTLSAGLFYDRLVKLDYNGPNPPGSYAADVQRPAAQYRDRYQKRMPDAVALYNRLATQGDDDLSAEAERQIGVIYRELTQRLPSRSPLRYLDQTKHYPDGLVDTMAGFELNVDGMTHVQYVTLLASYNHPPTMALLNEVAGGDPAKYPDRADDIKLAQAVLNKVASDKVGKAVASSSPVVVNGSASVTPAQVQQIASAAASAVTAQQAQQAPVTVGGTTGQLIGQAFDSLEALKGAQSDLSPQAKATVDALIGVLQSETGVSA